MSFIMSFDMTDTFTLEITLFTHFLCYTQRHSQDNVQFDFRKKKNTTQCDANKCDNRFWRKKNEKIKKENRIKSN